MIMRIDQPLDLKSTLLSGQAFRWRREGPWFHGVAFGNIVKVRRVDGGIELMSAPDDERIVEPLLRDYLGLGVDLGSIYAAISVDERLTASIERHGGMRILRQDPWECLISFICSSASNIPRITRNVESICATFGRPIRMGGLVRHAFPSPAELARGDAVTLRELGLGYRAEYISSTSRAVARGEIDLMPLREDSYDEALDALTALDGVGDKVANCVLLFSLDKPDAFPVDVWVERALQEWYLDGRKLSLKSMRLWARDHFGPYAGYANHYLFHDRRLLGRAGQPPQDKSAAS